MTYNIYDMKKEDLFYAVIGTLMTLFLSWALFNFVETEEGDQPYYNILAGAIIFALVAFTAVGWSVVFRSKDEGKSKFA